MKTFKSLPHNIQIILASLAILSIALVISNIIFINKIYVLSHPNEIAVDEIKSIVAEISKVIVLPPNETPTLATVSDPSKLKDQKFFANSQVGDKVLIYNASQKAILWRPSTKKIIEITSLTVTNPGTSLPTAH